MNVAIDPNPADPSARPMPCGSTQKNPRRYDIRPPCTIGTAAMRVASQYPRPPSAITNAPSDAKPSERSIATPSGAPIASAPYVAMPFHEITRALLLGPTRPIPQVIAPVPTQLSPKPSTRRPTISSARLTECHCDASAALSSSTPLIAQALRPYSTVCFGPMLSAVRPESGRETSVANDWTLIATPAITDP